MFRMFSFLSRILSLLSIPLPYLNNKDTMIVATTNPFPSSRRSTSFPPLVVSSSFLYFRFSFIFSLCFLLFLTFPIVSQGSCINTVAGGGSTVPSAFTSGKYLTTDVYGSLVFTAGNAVYKVNDDGKSVMRLAGSTAAGFRGDNGPAASSLLNGPNGIVGMDDGSFIVMDAGNNVIRRITSTGSIEVIAGTGQAGYSGDGGSALQAEIRTATWNPGIVHDKRTGILYFSDTGNHVVRKLIPASTVTNPLTGKLYVVNYTIARVAGTTQGYSGDNGPALSAQLKAPTALALYDSRLLISDRGNIRLREMNLDTGILKHVIGNGVAGPIDYGSCSPDHTNASTAGISSGITGIAFHPTDNAIVFADYYCYRIRMIDPLTQTIRTLAGTGLRGNSGDGGNASKAQFDGLRHIKYIGNDLYLIDGESNLIRVVRSATATIEVVVAASPPTVSDLDIPGLPAISVNLKGPRGLAVAENGDTYITDANGNSIRVLHPDGTIDKIAGTGQPCANTSSDCGDGGHAFNASLTFPYGIAILSNGDIIVADYNAHRVRKIDYTTRIITTIAGTGKAGYNGDGLATLTQFNTPSGVAVNAKDDVLILDQINRRVRLLQNGQIKTIAGSGYQGYLPANSNPIPALAANFSQIVVLSVGPDGAVYLCDAGYHVVYKLDPTYSTISLIAGIPWKAGEITRVGYSIDLSTGRLLYGDGNLATAATLDFPLQAVIDQRTNILYVSTSYDYAIRGILPNGTIFTVAGNNGGTFGGDGNDALSASLATPRGMAIDKYGNLFLAESGSFRVRQIVLTSTPNCPAGFKCPCGFRPQPCTNPTEFCPLGTQSQGITTSPGYFSLAVQTKTSPVPVFIEQAVCSVGYYCENGKQLACPQGTFGRYPLQPTVSSCRLCEKGYYLGEVGTAAPPNTVTPCQPCPAGSYGTMKGAPYCTICAPDTYQSMNGQQQCLPCPVSTFSFHGASQCIPRTSNDVTANVGDASVYRRSVVFEDGNVSDNKLTQLYYYVCGPIVAVFFLPFFIAVIARYLLPQSKQSVLIFLLYFLKRNDFFCDMSHPVKKGGVAIRNPTAIGGGFSLLAIGAFIAFCVSIIIQFVNANAFTEISALFLSPSEAMALVQYPPYRTSQPDLQEFIPGLEAGLHIVLRTSGRDCRNPVDYRENFAYGTMQRRTMINELTGDMKHIFTCNDCFVDDLSYLEVYFNSTCAQFAVTVTGVGAWGTVSSTTFVVSDMKDVQATVTVSTEILLDFIEGSDTAGTGYPTGGRSYRGFALDTARNIQTVYRSSSSSGSSSTNNRIRIDLPAARLFSRVKVSNKLTILQLISSLIGNLGILGGAASGFALYLFLVNKNRKGMEGRQSIGRVLFGKGYNEALSQGKSFIDHEFITTGKNDGQRNTTQEENISSSGGDNNNSSSSSSVDQKRGSLPPPDTTSNEGGPLPSVTMVNPMMIERYGVSHRRTTTSTTSTAPANETTA